jgi:hypothetical protein
MKVDTAQIPEETGRKIGESIISGLRKFMEQPGAREMLDARTRARHERRKANEATLSQA